MPAHYEFDASYFIRRQMFSQSIVLLWVVQSIEIVDRFFVGSTPGNERLRLPLHFTAGVGLQKRPSPGSAETPASGQNGSVAGLKPEVPSCLRIDARRLWVAARWSPATGSIKAAGSSLQSAGTC